jgi:hypothetical protein
MRNASWFLLWNLKIHITDAECRILFNKRLRRKRIQEELSMGKGYS